MISRISERISIAPCEALINAVLAWACRQFGAEFFGRHGLGYIAKARRALHTTLTQPEVLKDGDLFAGNILSWVGYSTTSKDSESTVRTHMDGSLAILDHIWNLSRNGGPHLSDSIVLFGPFIIDCASIWSTRYGSFPSRHTSFQQRVKYFDHLRLLTDKLGIHSAVREAINSTLGNLLELLLSGISKVARYENAGDMSNQSVRNSVILYVEAELGDPALLRALISTKREFLKNKNLKSVDEQWILRSFHRLRCILLLLSIFRAPTISEGVDSVNTAKVAKDLISHLRAQSIPRWAPIQDYYLISWHNYSHLLLGGMALSNGGCPQRNFSIALI
jgi:hypothetical protein